MTKEDQYSILYDTEKKHGRTIFGFMANESWNCDPKRTLFTLSRYKFVAKMFSGRERVLEIGCADAFGTRIVQQEVKHVVAIDFDRVFIEDIQNRINPHWPLTAFVHDMLAGPVRDNFDGVYCLDVLEHIRPVDEDVFMKNLALSLKSKGGAAIIGMPSLESQAYASPQSKAGHVNCKKGPELKKFLEKYFHNVFVFSMNDEVVHTGYSPMANYLLAMATEIK